MVVSANTVILGLVISLLSSLYFFSETLKWWCLGFIGLFLFAYLLQHIQSVPNSTHVILIKFNRMFLLSVLMYLCWLL